MDIDDCVSVTCPTNRTCVDRGVNSFECICLTGFEEINGSCAVVLQTEGPNTEPKHNTGKQTLSSRLVIFFHYVDN